MTKRTMPAQWKFFESYANAIEALASANERAAKEFLWTLYRYGSWGEEPDFEEKPMCALAFELARPNIDNSVRDSLNGKMGGQKKAANAKKKQEAEERKKAREYKKTFDAFKEAASRDDALPDEMLDAYATEMEDDRARRVEADIAAAGI